MFHAVHELKQKHSQLAHSNPCETAVPMPQEEVKSEEEVGDISVLEVALDLTKHVRGEFSLLNSVMFAIYHEETVDFWIFLEGQEFEQRE